METNFTVLTKDELPINTIDFLINNYWWIVQQKLLQVQQELLQALKSCNENGLVFFCHMNLCLNPSLMTVPETLIVKNHSQTGCPLSDYNPETNFSTK